MTMLKSLFSLTALCLAIAGCASKPEFQQKTYQYDSKEHSGTVAVTETTNVPDEQCTERWRDERTYQPNGVQQITGFRIEIQILDHSPDTYGNLIKVELPSNHGRDVLVRDFQKDKTLMVGVDKNGMVKQGDLFYFPEGYFVRAAQPQFKDENLSFCLGVDRTYVPSAELNTPNPLIHMDRLNVRFNGKPGEEKTFNFGSVQPISVNVRAVPL
ncbi:hypothetical protein HBO10_24330 [Pseudomonas sp. WS 5503]|jgi:hypothetical protein|uniref:hypothetical protein n=2 Tax=Pseudomonas TaxID=286 RepID=UPI000E312465|nr:hypothetical protein [Pseudomonas savastanoi]NMX82657.1 hypothetical protein [Pseudomonas sp. WS 5503]NNB23772.1 hypothetical protein [Pseudomonas fragi]